MECLGRWHILVFDDISFSYPGANRTVFEHVSFALSAGERVVLLGANGTGKSTIAKLANAIMLPTSGHVMVDGVETDSAPDLRAIRTKVGVVAQDPATQIVSSSVCDEVAFGPENLGLERAEIRRRVEASIAAVGLKGKEKREPHTLSGGEQQRLAIAGVLAMEPTYMVLDEPTAMLDTTGREEVMGVIDGLQERGCGILHITHDAAESMQADRVLVLSDSHIISDATPLELASSDVFARADVASSGMLRLAMLLRRGGVKLPKRFTTPVALAAAVQGAGAAKTGALAGSHVPKDSDALYEGGSAPEGALPDGGGVQ